MKLQDFLASGIIENFCLGFSSDEESKLVKKMAAAYPEVQQELDEVRTSLHLILKRAEIKPARSVKMAVMKSIYSQQASIEPGFVPLLDTVNNFDSIYAALAANDIHWPTENFDNLYAQELPSTREIINFAVWVKNGHEEEMHTDRNEFIAVLEGSCEMVMQSGRTKYGKGDIINIPINVPHSAEITSAEPMFALVQRQLTAS